MRGPQRRPASVVAVTSPGASVSLSRSSDIEPRRVAAMELRPLGRTGVQVSPLCLGAMMFGAWGNTDHEDSIRIIHRALDAGINFIDTADVFSRGESEEIGGKALAGGRRENVVLATKVHGRMRPWTLVASTTFSRRPPASALPPISSDSPRENTSAVSMKLIPASSARWMMRIESSWSVLPHAPNIIAPRQSGLTCTPVRPSGRRSMAATLRSSMSLLLLKLTLAPGLVTATTLAGRRWGPRMAGWLGGLPVVVAPILLAITLEHGRSFGSRAAGGALLGLLSLTGFVLAYGWCARVMGWLPAAAPGWLGFLGMALLLDEFAPPNWVWFVAVCSSFALAAALLPRAAAEPAGAAPRFDLLLRAAATAALVLLLMGLAGALGPRLSGLLASFPVLATVLAAFTHVQEGPAAAAQLLRGFATGLVAFAVFCFVVAEMLPHHAIAAAFLI